MRLFVGLPVPPSPRYGELAREVKAAAPQARLVPAGNQHVTVRFLGEVHDAAPVIAALDAACQGRPALPCVVEGLGTFPDARFPPNKRARVAWVGVRAAGVEALADAIVQATAGFGEPPEPRRFIAHVTLARLPQPADLRSLVDRHHDTLVAQGVLDRVVLFRSRLGAGPGGASMYEPMHAVRLGPRR